MSVLDLNLASRPFRNNVPLWTVYGAAAVLLAGFTWWNVHAYVEASREGASLRSSLSGLDAKMADLDRRWNRANEDIARIDVKSLQARAAKANEFIDNRAMSWTRLFNLLENVVPYEVRMTSIRPASVFGEGSERRSAAPAGTIPVTVEGLAQNFEAFLEFERDLILDPHFGQVDPEKADFLPAGELRFSLKFLYDADGRKGFNQELTLPHSLPAAAAADGETVPPADAPPAASPGPAQAPTGAAAPVPGAETMAPLAPTRPSGPKKRGRR